MALPAPAPLAACAVKVTRTPLAGGGSTVYTESRDAPLRRIRRCAAHHTQSIGDQNGILELDNVGGYFDAWSSGDVLRIETKRPQDAAYGLLLEGFIGEPVDRPGPRPLLTIPVVGLNSVLDLITLDADAVYDATAYTTMFDDLCTTYLAGYTRTITSDAAAGSMTFRQGMKLREALDIIRRALVAATSPSKWELVASKDGATKEIRLFKRASASQATLSYAQALIGTQRSRGSAYHVINKAKVLGATVPRYSIDKTTLAADGVVVLDATTDWVAQPFTALDTPLAAHTTYGDRSSGQDPPSLAGSVARNSDNYDLIGANMVLRTPEATLIRNRAVTAGVVRYLTDNTGASVVSWSIPVDGAYYEIAVWDFGAGNSRYISHATVITAAGNLNGNVRLEGSNDDSAWTTLGTSANTTTPGASYVVVSNPAGPYRYYRMMVRSGGAAALNVTGLMMAEFDNASTDATNPHAIQHQTLEYVPAVTAATLSTTGNSTKELFRTDFRAARPLAKLIFSHEEDSTLGTITLNIQKSANGSDWEDIAVLAVTTSLVVDNLYLDEPDLQYLRIAVVDTRAGGSAAVTITGYYFVAFEQTLAWDLPIPGDALRGSGWTWSVSNMVAHPAAFEETTWPAPRLTLVTGRSYWFLYKPQSGASAQSFWELDYAADPGILQFVENGGMEVYPGTTGVPTAWTNLGTLPNASITRETTNIAEGLYAIKATGNGAGTLLITQTLSGLIVGTEYTAEAKLRSGTAAVLCRLRIWNVTDGVMVVQADQTVASVATYEKVFARWTPASGKTYRLDLKATLGTPANLSIHYFDSVRLYPTGDVPGEALVSVNTGSTWTPVAQQATLRHLTEFNIHQLVGEAEDAASQATFANFVPGGILYGGLSDEALITQDMVTKEAEALVAGRKAIKPRIQYVVGLQPSLTTGLPVTLAADNLLPLGTSGDLDVLEVTHEALPGGKTTLVLNDHAPEVALASESALAYATGRSI